MKTITIALVFLIVFSLSFAFGQKSTENEYQKIYKHSLGIGVGFTTGLGISYRYFPKKFGFQLNVAPYYQDYGNEAFVSAGATILCNLAENRITAVYAYLGNHYFYQSNKSNESRWDPVTQQYIYDNTKTIKKDFLNTGIGFGFEFNTSKRVTLNLMGGYAQYNSFEKLFFTGEMALYYRFN